MPNYRNTMQKLQRALCAKGQPITVDEKRFYSIRYQRMLTKYIAKRNVPGQRRETIIETYSIVEVVKKLAEIYGATGGT